MCFADDARANETDGEPMLRRLERCVFRSHRRGAAATFPPSAGAIAVVLSAVMASACGGAVASTDASVSDTQDVTVPADASDVLDARDTADTTDSPRDVPADDAPDASDGSPHDVNDSGYCVPLRADGCPLNQPPGGLAPVCEISCPASDVGHVCEYTAARCACRVGSGYTWFCEPLACPVDGPVTDASCTTVGLRCGAGFENRGSICIPGDEVWVQCAQARRDTSGFRYHCPPTPPVVGTRCCIEDPGFVGADCPYPDGDGGTTIYACVSYHWSISP